MSDKSGKPKDVLQPVDEGARRLAKTLLRTARFAALAGLDPLDGSPTVSRVNLATAMDGRPVFLISRLSGHFAALEGDPRASLLVGEPGKGDPIAHPRMTLIGTVARISDEAERQVLRRRFLARHPKSALYADFPDFAFWIFTPQRVSLNGGFGKAFAPGPGDLVTDMSGCEGLQDMEAGAVEHMNDDHRDAIDHYAALAGRSEAGWRLSGIDPEGVDLVRGDLVARVWFDPPLESASDLRARLVALARQPAGDRDQAG